MCTDTRTQEIVASITRDDDGAHVLDLLRLLKTTGAKENMDGEKAMQALYVQTDDFEKHFQDFISRL